MSKIEPWAAFSSRLAETRRSSSCDPRNAGLACPHRLEECAHAEVGRFAVASAHPNKAHCAIERAALRWLLPLTARSKSTPLSCSSIRVLGHPIRAEEPSCSAATRWRRLHPDGAAAIRGSGHTIALCALACAAFPGSAASSNRAARLAGDGGGMPRRGAAARCLAREPAACPQERAVQRQAREATRTARSVAPERVAKAPPVLVTGRRSVELQSHQRGGARNLGTYLTLGGNA